MQGVCTTESPLAANGSLHASQQLAKSAYLFLKKELLESFRAPFSIACALDSAIASSFISSDLFIYFSLFNFARTAWLS